MTYHAADRIIKVRAADIRPNPFQPEGRIVIGEETARKFGQSILEHGLLQTPVGRLAGEVCEMGDGWLRCSGYCWLAEHGHPQFAEIEVTIREFTDQQMADLVMETNRVRQDLNPIELASFYKKYLEKFPSVTQAELAKRQGTSQGEIANTIRLLKLPDDVQRMIISGEITEAHGRALLQVKEKNLQSEYARKAVGNSWNVAALDAVIKTYLASRKPRMVEAPAKPKPATPVITEAQTEAPTERSTEAPTKPTKPEESGTKPMKPEESGTKPMKPEETGTKPNKAGEGGSKPTAAPAPSRPAVNWGRKLVIEEKSDHVLISVMKAGGFPAFRKVNGGLHDVLNSPSMDNDSMDFPLYKFLRELEAEWSKEVK